jgi:dCTP deaminase
MINMILSGKEIRNKLGREIIIEPFNERQLNSNSYNLKLHNELAVYESSILDAKKDNRISKIAIPQKGIILNPGRLYLGRTVEYTETKGYVPMIEGRSSIGRLGMFIHVTAGFGDVGFCGYWTLEISCIQPVRIYPGIEICQIFYHEITGDVIEYNGKYQNSKDIQQSLIFKELLIN